MGLEAKLTKNWIRSMIRILKQTGSHPAGHLLPHEKSRLNSTRIFCLEQKSRLKRAQWEIVPARNLRPDTNQLKS